MAVYFSPSLKAQTDIFTPAPEHVGLWQASELFIGAIFVYLDVGDVIVTKTAVDAGWTGSLFVVNGSSPDDTVYLFQNHDPDGTSVNLADLGVNFALGDTVVFMYQIVSGPPASPVDNWLPKYTGTNDDPAHPLYTTVSHPTDDHRWSVAGRVNDSIVEFGFEDNVTGFDGDYNDVIFEVSNLVLNVEQVDTVQITNPADTVFYSYLDKYLTVETPDARVFYSVDGVTDPIDTNSANVFYYTPGVPVRFIDSTTIMIRAFKEHLFFSELATANFYRLSSQSAIEILDGSGGALTNSILPGSSTTYSVRLLTNYYDSPDLSAGISSEDYPDTETLTINSITGGPTPGCPSLAGGGYPPSPECARIYTELGLPLKVDISPATSGTLDANEYDTVVITFTNPLDPNDIAKDTVYVQPSDVSAAIQFSTTADLSGVTSAFAETVPRVYVIVTDQSPNPSQSYSATLTSNTGESETIPLSISDSLLVGSLPSTFAPLVTGNASLDVNLAGNTLFASYTDPYYGEVANNSATYAAKSVTPVTADPPSGTWFINDTTITLSTAGGASIRYTTDGNDPTNPATASTAHLYTGPIPISSSVIIKAVAYFQFDSLSNHVESSLLTATYFLRDTVGNPFANPGAAYFTNDTTVYLIPADTTDNIWYTTNGTEPDSTDPANTTRYDYNNPGILINANTTLKFYSTSGYDVSSDTVTEVYTRRLVLVPPVISPTTSTFSNNVSVTITHAVDSAIIYYTLDGTDPDEGDLVYSGAINITTPTTVKAVAYSPLEWVNSSITTEQFIPELTVSANPTGTSFTSSQVVSLSSNNVSAAIYYTLDGNDPDSSAGGSTVLYTGTPITLTNTTTVKAIAVLSEWWTSSILSETYTRTSTASLLEILDQNSLAFPGDILHADVTAYRVRISTNYEGSSTLTHNDSASVSDDVEPFNTTTITGSSGSHSRIFNDPFTVALASSTDSDGTLQISGTDTLVVTWVNPFDATDVVSDTVYVQPVDTTATAYFSLTSGGTATATYAEATTPVYIVVEDQLVSPALTYQATLTTATGESETLTLTPSGGKLIAQLPADYAAVTASDGTLNVNLGGEQLTVTYIDPLYTADTATGVAEYTGRTVATPTIIPSNGTFFETDTSFWLATVTAGASINYTLDNSLPDESTGTAYSDSVDITTSTIIRAVAYISNGPGNFAISNDTLYTLNLRGQLGIPSADPPTTYFSDDTTVVLTPADGADTVWYTLDGSVPDTSNPSRLEYTGAIAVAQDTLILKFYATNGDSVPSIVVTETYIKRDTLVAPTATPATTAFSGNLDVSLSHPVSGVQIRYTINGGTPTQTSPLYSSTLNFTQPTVLRAIAFNPVGVDAYVQSPMMTETYTPILTISADPLSETFDFQDTIVLSSNNVNAAIYYTVDGVTTPTTGSTLYTGAPVIVSSTTTIQAIAVLTDWQTSAVLSETYTRNSTSSLLELLDSNGIALADDILEGDQNKYSVQISTNYGALTTLSATASTLNSGDSETLTLTTITGASGTHARIFLDQYNFSMGAVTASDGTLQASGYDTIVVTWTNPLDGTDTVTDSLYVQPSDVTSAIYLATGNQLADTTSTFTESDNTLYVIVTDQEPHDDSTFTAVITTPTGDNETVTLTWQDSMFVGSVPVNYDSTDVGGSTLQINLGGELIQVSYKDPLYPTDISNTTATFGATSVATPILVPPLTDSLYFHEDTTIIFSTSTSGAIIRYVIGGGDPAFNMGTQSDTAVVTNFVSRVNAIAYLYHDDNNYVESQILETIFFKRGITRDPTATPQGPYFTESIDVTLLSFDPLNPDVIYYTTNGNDPDTTSGTLYATPVTITGDTVVLKFFAVNGTNMPSNVISFTYIKRDTLPPPVASPGDGTVFSGTVDVTLSHVTVPDARIFYTLDGSEPDSTDNLFTSALTFSNPTTLKAVAYGALTGPDQWVRSVSAEFNYIPKVATPVADPPSGTFVSEIYSQLNVSTQGATLYYTLDGSTPDTNSTPYTQIIRFTNSDTLKVVAVKPGWANSEILEVIYTKETTSSTLRILDGNQQEVDYLTEKNTSVVIFLQSAEANLTATDAVSVTLIKADNETVTLLQSGRNGNLFNFITEVSFSVTIGSNTVNGVIDANPFDTLVVTWTNPNNPDDVATDRVPVIPFPTESIIYFTDESGGDVHLTEYEGTEDTVYIVVKDQIWDETKDYTVTVETNPIYGDNRIPDAITLPLVELDSGVYGVAVPVDNNPTADTDDNLLQLVSGDVILATYVDPVLPDTSTAQIPYGGPGEVPGEIYFTDAEGVEIPNGVFWNPSEDSLYITYIDDYTENPKDLLITVVNTTGTGKVTYDTLVVPLGTPTQKDSIGTWTVAIPMNEVETPDTSNGTVDVFFEGEVTASVESHLKDGAASTIIKDVLTVANDNEEETVDVVDSEGGSEIFRTSDSLTITLNEQNFTGETDTLLVTVQCLESGDIMTDVILVEQDGGIYQGTIHHNEDLPAGTDDGALSCTPGDQVRVTYIDPIYETDGIVTREITVETGQTLAFVDANGDVITNLDEFEGSEFKVVATAFSESTSEIDTLQVTLTTSSGDQVAVTLIETGEFTGVFESDMIEYTFVYGETDPPDGVLVVDTLDASSLNNSGTVTATLVTPQDSTSSNLKIESAYIPADKAWIVDGFNAELGETGSDGVADTIYVQFVANLRELPESITNINWPGDNPDNFTATLDDEESMTEISFFVDENGDTDSSIIVIVLKDGDEVFDYGATSSGENQTASITLPDNIIFKGQEVEIEDRIGPVVVRAERLPSDLNNYKYEDDEGITRFRQNPDSIIITFSEEIIQLTNSGVPWDSLVMFSATCDKDSGHFLITFEGQEPTVLEADSAGNPRWLFVITNEQGVYKPTDQGCVWLNPSARYTDVVGNYPADHDVDPEGLNNSNIISDSYIFHPLIGMDDPGSDVSIVGTSYYDQDGNLVTPEPMYIVPHGMNPDGTTMSLRELRNECGSDPAPETEDFREFKPNCLSAVYVESQTGYAAHVDIYDHLGKFINSSVQYFGLCGELENNNRRGSDGFRSWLVWNTRDDKGNFVGSGVYIFRVRYLPLPTGNNEDVNADAIMPLSIYKQGIARSEPPDRNCAE